MEQVTETTRTPLKRVVLTTGRNACLVHIYPTGPCMGSLYTLGNHPLVLGRGEDCDIRVDDNGASRRHARVDHVDNGYQVVDLQSTNGTQVNNETITVRRLTDGDHLRIGNTIYRFLAGGNIEAEYHEEIYRLTIMDALTGVHNKRYLLEFLDRELSRSARHRRPLALILFDIDNFKRINDELGHLGGDYTLRDLVACVTRNMRKEDLLARYGGEEFVIVLVEAPREGATEVAERVRRKVEAFPFQYDGVSFPVTISLGVACTMGEEPLTPEEMIRLADEKLYQAKRLGRNRVVV